jgi:hypothetical protein
VLQKVIAASKLRLKISLEEYLGKDIEKKLQNYYASALLTKFATSEGSRLHGH